MKSRARGAVFVESIIVISALTLGLTGIVFFRDSYQKQLGALRLARAAAIAHSMAGCKANAPRDWLGPDVDHYRVSDPRQDSESAPGGTQAQQPSTSDGGRSKRLLGKTGGTTSDGEGLLNPITTSEASGQSRVTDKSGLEREHTVFSANPRSRSFVTCGDEIKDGDYDQVLEMIKEEAQALFNTR